MIEKISTHSSKYRNFIIVKLPAKALMPITRYNVQRDDLSYGLFDSMSDAAKYIDSLYAMRDIHPYIDELPFHQL